MCACHLSTARSPHQTNHQSLLPKVMTMTKGVTSLQCRHQVCMYVRTYVRMYVCMYVCMYVYMYVCMHVCLSLSVCCLSVCMHVCMHVRNTIAMATSCYKNILQPIDSPVGFGFSRVGLLDGQGTATLGTLQNTRTHTRSYEDDKRELHT